jgi:hypothetical protein
MIYPSAGIAVSTGTAWGTSIVNDPNATAWLTTPTATNLGIALGSQTQNTVFAAPNGAAGDAVFRPLVAADLPSGLPTPLSSITSATATPAALINGANNQTWNWQETTGAPAFTIGETAASSGGTVTAGVNNQAILQALTAPASTATPFSISQGALTTVGVTPPALQIQSTWNSGTNVFSGITESITNTASSGSSNLLNLLVGGTNQFTVGVAGTTYSRGSVTTSGNYTAATYPALAESNAVNATIVVGGTDTGVNGVAGPIMLKGSNNNTNSATASGGTAILQGGYLTSGGSNGGAMGAVEVMAGFFKGAAIASNEDIVCASGSFTVTDCAITPAVNVVGIALNNTGGNTPVPVVMEGTTTVALDAAGTLGDIVCLSTTVAGKGHDNGTAACATAGAQVGVIIATSGSVTVSVSSTGVPSNYTITTTGPLVALHFR